MSEKMFNPLFYGQNFTEMKIPGSKVDKNWIVNGFLTIFDPILFPTCRWFFSNRMVSSNYRRTPIYKKHIKKANKNLF